MSKVLAVACCCIFLFLEKPFSQEEFSEKDMQELFVWFDSLGLFPEEYMTDMKRNFIKVSRPKEYSYWEPVHSYTWGLLSKNEEESFTIWTLGSESKRFYKTSIDDPYLIASYEKMNLIKNFVPDVLKSNQNKDGSGK